MTRWAEAGGVNNLLPEYVDRRYRVSGSLGTGGFVTLHMVNAARSQPSPGDWRVDDVTLSR